MIFPVTKTNFPVLAQQAEEWKVSTAMAGMTVCVLVVRRKIAEIQLAPASALVMPMEDAEAATMAMVTMGTAIVTLRAQAVTAKIVRPKLKGLTAAVTATATAK